MECMLFYSHWETHIAINSATCQMKTYPHFLLPACHQTSSIKHNKKPLHGFSQVYPCIPPRSVVYAPMTVGGVGFYHLGFEQGVQQVLQLLCHSQSKILNGQLCMALINTYQLYAGIQVSNALFLKIPGHYCGVWEGRLLLSKNSSFL